MDTHDISNELRSRKVSWATVTPESNGGYKVDLVWLEYGTTSGCGGCDRTLDGAFKRAFESHDLQERALVGPAIDGG